MPTHLHVEVNYTVYLLRLRNMVVLLYECLTCIKLFCCICLCFAYLCLVVIAIFCKVRFESFFFLYCYRFNYLIINRQLKYEKLNQGPVSFSLSGSTFRSATFSGMD